MKKESHLESRSKNEKTVNKSALAKFYGVSPKTFYKSISIFCGDIFERNRDFKKIRTFTPLQVNVIKMRLGEAPFLWKRDIVKITDNTIRIKITHLIECIHLIQK